MPNQDRIYQVFVSSTYEDLKEERAQVLRALLELDCMPIGMEYFPAASVDQWTAIKALIDNCDYYIVISAGRYGSRSKETKLSYTEMEYDYAIAKDIPTTAFLRSELDELPGRALERTATGRNRLERFRRKLEGRLCKYYSSAHELASVVKSSLTNLTREAPRAGWVRGAGIGTLTPSRFVTHGFREAIDYYSSQHRLAVRYRDSSEAVLEAAVAFESNFTQRQHDYSNYVFVKNGDPDLELIVHSTLCYESDEAVDAEMCKLFMYRNSVSSVGTWSLTEMSDKQMPGMRRFSCRHIVDPTAVNGGAFAMICDHLVKEVGQMDVVAEMIPNESRQHPLPLPESETEF